MKTTNKIPRNMEAIIIKMKIDTSATKAGDAVKITKNNFGYLGYVYRTNSYYYFFPAMLRCPECCEFECVLTTTGTVDEFRQYLTISRKYDKIAERMEV